MIPVTSHQHQSVDGDIGCDINDVLDSATPKDAEWPVHEDIVTGSKRNTDENEQEIGNSEVENQQVCCVLHLGVCIDLEKRNCRVI